MIKDEDITRFNSKWMQKALLLIPDRLLHEQQNLAKILFSEVFTAYARSMRQSIMDYILLCPQERKRIHILMLPRKFPSAHESSLMKGGYSLIAYSGQHYQQHSNFFSFSLE
ncbi:hypothetical protein FGO68_gene8563 [Halteria grandinella]|uniref:Uncharacterized protein n=1 Tax=Halteria grandinella TaxID=5974 RepID=A0A8J8NAJ6_HALGN|nr:hypothetical protein FGO68_gene8563 [Halteria grandinella]